MTGYRVELAHEAEGDIGDAFLWYRERNALIADAFRTEVFDTIERIAAAPLGSAADEESNRKRVLHRFPYSVVYEVLGSTVTILAVTHHRRMPGYWRSHRG
ncbi:MAG TPA: type II toxin-antitoxin system RelE/ParE family toxin [Burkholderiaceae bacterium]|nr:type II toxin-antitoxin system RelE/ParE family toxin [Burkholderiaceae bacterium]